MSKADDFLEHYGVKGMRWGIRRRSGKPASRTTYQKKPHRLSDAELNRRIKRMELEKKYSELNNTSTFNGRHYAQSLMENSGRTLVGALVGGAAGYFLRRELTHRFPIPD